MCSGDTVDKWCTLQNGGNCKDSRRQHLRVGGTNRGKDIVCCVIDTGDDVAVAFRVGSPEHDYTTQTVLFFEPPHIGPECDRDELVSVLAIKLPARAS